MRVVWAIRKVPPVHINTPFSELPLHFSTSSVTGIVGPFMLSKKKEQMPFKCQGAYLWYCSPGSVNCLRELLHLFEGSLRLCFNDRKIIALKGVAYTIIPGRLGGFPAVV